MKSILTTLLLFLAPAASGSTLVKSGVLNSSTGPDRGGAADGSFFLSFSGSTLNYQISTRSLGTSFDPAQVGLMLGLPFGDLALPVLSYQLVGVSGCGLSFAAAAPHSYQISSDNYFFFGLGIHMPPGDCRSYFQFSILTGSVALTPEQQALFTSPDFTLSSSSLDLYGRTDPNVIPEPQTIMLAAVMGLVLLRRRAPRRTISSFILHPSSFLS